MSRNLNCCLPSIREGQGGSSSWVGWVRWGCLSISCSSHDPGPAEGRDWHRAVFVRVSPSGIECLICLKVDPLRPPTGWEPFYNPPKFPPVPSAIASAIESEALQGVGAHARSLRGNRSPRGVWCPPPRTPPRVFPPLSICMPLIALCGRYCMPLTASAVPFCIFRFPRISPQLPWVCITNIRGLFYRMAISYAKFCILRSTQCLIHPTFRKAISRHTDLVFFSPIIFQDLFHDLICLYCSIDEKIYIFFAVSTIFSKFRGFLSWVSHTQHSNEQNQCLFPQSH